MKSVSILIPNFNSYEAIQLAIESVRKFTPHQDYEIIVFDDGSYNGVDLPYLEEKEKLGWIRLLRGEKNLGHGHALNSLILNACKTDLTVIMDSDIQILEEGWLEELTSLIKDYKTLLVTGTETNLRTGRPSLNVWFQSWLMLLNMKAYKDGMQVDWRHGVIDDIYYPVGARLWLKVQNDNPKGYEIIGGLPKSLQDKFKHHIHISCIATPSPSDPPRTIAIREERMGKVREELKGVR